MSFTCRNMSFTCRNMSFTCRNMSFTCRNMSFTCRNMSFTCRNMSFTCRNMSFTCRNMSFTCSSSLVFYVVLFWFVCLRPVSCVANVCVCVWMVHSWLPLRYVLSFTIIIQRYQPPYIENQCRLKIITNNILPLTVPSSIQCCFWVMISASSAILLTNWYFDVVMWSVTLFQITFALD